MKVTLQWLRQYVDFDWDAAQLADRLTQLGLEVEGIHTVAGEFEGIVVGEVVTRDKVAGSDKLSVCRVRDGKGERQIICGANNFKPGDKVPLILPNFALPLKPGEKEPFVIKVRKVLGVESHGMLCSPRELGLADDAEGLLLLRADAPTGQPFAEYLGRSTGDVVLDLEITPNRPDLNSVIGIAREISAVTGNPVRLPSLAASPAPGGPPVAVRLDAPDLCARYSARRLTGVKIGPSPDWLRGLLEKVGLRSINNVVDITNYVMLETGQPLHAFDTRLLAVGDGGLPTIVVRRARDGEHFTTLDGREHVLTSEMLLIADPSKPVALAGIMGGLNSGIGGDTTDVVLESAWFSPSNIRRTSKALALRTDASYRFERGADIEGIDAASRRAARMITELAGGVDAGAPVEAYPAPVAPREVTLRHDRVNQLLGLTLTPDEIELHLAQLGLKPARRKPRSTEAPTPAEPVTLRIPSWRIDLKREVDLVEEVARLYGVDRIPATPPRGATGQHPFDAVQDQFSEVRSLLAAQGLCEAFGQTLIRAVAARRVAGEETLVPLRNPLSSDMDVLRPSLLPGLLDSIANNLARRHSDVQLFEIGRVFRRVDGRVREGWKVAAAMTGARQPGTWSGADRDARCDVFDLKGVAEALLEHFGFRGLVFARRPAPTGLLLESAAVTLGGKIELGQIGLLLPSLAREIDARDPVFLLELDLDEILGRQNAARGFKALPSFPSVRRDLAMLVAESVSHDAVLGAVRQAKAPNLESVEIFDVFRGRNVPDGQKSLAYAFTYRAPDKTLTDAEVNAAHARVVDAMKRAVQAVVRE